MTELLIRHVKKTRKNSRMVYAATGQAGNLKINGITWRDCLKFGFHFAEISKFVNKIPDLNVEIYSLSRAIKEGFLLSRLELN